MGEHVVWIVEARIQEGQREAFEALKDEILETVEGEPGTLIYEWSLAPDGSLVHIYERFRDAGAALAHLQTWGRFAERFLALAPIERLVVCTDLSSQLEEALAGLQPVRMTPIGGVSR